MLPSCSNNFHLNKHTWAQTRFSPCPRFACEHLKSKLSAFYMQIVSANLCTLNKNPAVGVYTCTLCLQRCTFLVCAHRLILTPSTWCHTYTQSDFSCTRCCSGTHREQVLYKNTCTHAKRAVLLCSVSLRGSNPNLQEGKVSPVGAWGESNISLLDANTKRQPATADKPICEKLFHLKKIYYSYALLDIIENCVNYRW